MRYRPPASFVRAFLELETSFSLTVALYKANNRISIKYDIKKRQITLKELFEPLQFGHGMQCKCGSTMRVYFLVFLKGQVGDARKKLSRSLHL